MSEDHLQRETINTQFPPGTSGNPKGRPRKPRRAAVPSQFMKDVIKAGEEKVTITVSGKQMTVSMNEALLRALQKHALSGKVMALKIWFQLHRDALLENLIREPTLRLLEDFAVEIRARGFDPANNALLDAVAKRSLRPD